MEERIYSQLIDYIQGRSSDEERETLFDLIEQSDQVAEAFYELQEIYQPSDLSWNSDSAWDKWKMKKQKESVGGSRIVPLFSVKNILKIAAVILPLVIALTFILGPDTSSVVDPEWVSVTTSEGETKDVSLPDGTIVTLNELSDLKYDANFSQRNVEFHGEGLFAVAKDPTRTFTVSNDITRVSVLGTRFNINSSNETGKIEVAVIEGKVKLEAVDQPTNFVFLERNDLGSYSINSKELTKTTTNAENSIGWKTLVLDYERQTLNKVIADLEKIYKIKFSYTDERIGNCTYKVNFQNYSVDQVIAALEFALNGQISFNQSEWVIDAEPCN